MILINIKMQIRPEKIDDWLAVADAYAKDVNSEDGCLFFQWSRSLTDDNEFICIEGFTDAEAGGAHPGLGLGVGHRDVEVDPVPLRPRRSTRR